MCLSYVTNCVLCDTENRLNNYSFVFLFPKTTATFRGICHLLDIFKVLFCGLFIWSQDTKEV